MFVCFFDATRGTTFECVSHNCVLKCMCHQIAGRSQVSPAHCREVPSSIHLVCFPTCICALLSSMCDTATRCGRRGTILERKPGLRRVGEVQQCCKSSPNQTSSLRATHIFRTQLLKPLLHQSGVEALPADDLLY